MDRGKKMASDLARYTSALLFVIFTSANCWAAQCVREDGSGGCFTSIQAAVGAAVAGEVIAIYPGNYDEGTGVTVDKNNLQLVGQGGWPGDVRIQGSAAVVSLSAPQTRLENVSVNNSPDGVIVTGANASIVNVRIAGCTGTGITVTANDVQIATSTIYGIDGAGIVATGNGFSVRSSVVKGTGGNCIEVNGNNATIQANRVYSCGTQGVLVVGSAARVLENTLSVAQEALILVEGPGPLIRGNQIAGGGNNAISVDSDSPIVRNNTAMDCASGINVHCGSCGGGSVSDNVVINSYNSRGFTIQTGAAGMSVINNQALYCKVHGFEIDGPGMVVQNNRAKNNGSDGFNVGPGSTGMRLLDNTANVNARDGIRVESGATGTKLRRNRAHNNHHAVDFHDDGTDTILGSGSDRNYFETTGP